MSPLSLAPASLLAGAAAVEITPTSTQFLWGYPHVERFSTGVHDPLLSSALCLSDGTTAVLFIANDLIFVPKALALSARRRLRAATGIPESHIMITATHTHSGPGTVDYLSNEADPVVPKADQEYLRFAESRIVEAGEQAWRQLEPAAAGLTCVQVTGLGTNRRDPIGPADPQVPALLVRAKADGRPLALMLVCAMHPTVLHEDSTLVSADFPGAAREFLQREPLGPGCPVLHHTGAAGNQSPRHVVRGHTFAEMERLGRILGAAVMERLPGIELRDDLRLAAAQAFIEMKPRDFPPVEEAEARLVAARGRLEALRRSGAPRPEVRTAECDVFGAEETLTLARAARDGRLEKARRSAMPAEVQVIAVGPWRFVGWSGEFFVEYALEVKARARDTFIITLANGELQGYVVTPEAAAEGGYEASNALFAHTEGARVVETTLNLLARLGG